MHRWPHTLPHCTTCDSTIAVLNGLSEVYCRSSPYFDRMYAASRYGDGTSSHDRYIVTPYGIVNEWICSMEEPECCRLVTCLLSRRELINDALQECFEMILGNCAIYRREWFDKYFFSLVPSFTSPMECWQQSVVDVAINAAESNAPIPYLCALAERATGDDRVFLEEEFEELSKIVAGRKKVPWGHRWPNAD